MEAQTRPPPSFHPFWTKKVFRKIIDAEGPVLEPFECGHEWIVSEASPLNNQVEERVQPPSRGPFKGSRSKASPTRPSVSERTEEEYVLLLPDRGGSLKRLHRPNLFGLDCMGFKEHQSFKISYEHQSRLPSTRAL